MIKKLFICTVCGYVHEGVEAPDNCPKCNAPKDKFTEMDSEAASKIYRSDRMNDIHMELIELCGRIGALCKEGIQDNLDPKCVSIFEKARDEAWIIKQRSKAELVGHMKNGKW